MNIHSAVSRASHGVLSRSSNGIGLDSRADPDSLGDSVVSSSSLSVSVSVSSGATLETVSSFFLFGEVVFSLLHRLIQGRFGLTSSP